VKVFFWEKFRRYKAPEKEFLRGFSVIVNFAVI
jgi:hypothetical protein